jgi:hypothetical protein
MFGPGVPLPAQPIQIVEGYVSNSANTTTSTTFVVSGLTASITPVSAASIIKIDVRGTQYSTALAICQTQISRGNTANTNMIGSIGEAQYGGGTGAQATAVNMSAIALDKPNTTSAQIYAAQFKTNNASNSAGFGDATPSVMTLTEIMG